MIPDRSEQLPRWLAIAMRPGVIVVGIVVFAAGRIWRSSLEATDAGCGRQPYHAIGDGKTITPVDCARAAPYLDVARLLLFAGATIAIFGLAAGLYWLRRPTLTTDSGEVCSTYDATVDITSVELPRSSIPTSG